MPHSIQQLKLYSKFWETNRNLAEPQRIVYCPQGIFSRTFARQSDQFKRDFCWSDHIFYDLGPWSDSYFEDWLRCVNVWSSLTDKSTLAKIWLVACRHQAFLNQILNQIWNAKTWKKIGHLFYATSSSVHHFIDIGEFKLGLQSGNT